MKKHIIIFILLFSNPILSQYKIDFSSLYIQYTNEHQTNDSGEILVKINFQKLLTKKFSRGEIYRDTIIYHSICKRILFIVNVKYLDIKRKKYVRKKRWVMLKYKENNTPLFFYIIFNSHYLEKSEHNYLYKKGMSIHCSEGVSMED